MVGGQTYSYLGCFKNLQNAARVNGHLGPFTYKQCEEKASVLQRPAFGLEGPLRARTHCLLLYSEHFKMARAIDPECEAQLDSAGHRLGSQYRLAVYTID